MAPLVSFITTVIFLLCCSLRCSVAAPDNIGIVNYGTAIFGDACTVDNPSCSGLGYPSWCCSLGNTCTFDRNHDVVCCPNGMYCDGNSPYLPTTTPAFSVTQVTTTAAALPATTADPPAPQFTTIISQPGTPIMNVGGSDIEGSNPTIYKDGQTKTLVGIYRIVAFSLGAIIILV